jgi:hypothetical protein
MKKDMGIKVKLDQIINSDALDASSREWVRAKKATILINNQGTLIEAEDGGLYLIPVGLWFRSEMYNKGLPQVDDFNKLQDLGLTAIKDKIVRHQEKREKKEIPVKSVGIKNGQEVRGEDNVSPEKVDQTVAANIEGEKKD